MMNNEKLLTPVDVADRLQVNKRTVTQWLRKGQLRGFKIGREWRVSVNDLEALLEASANKACKSTSKWERGREIGKQRLAFGDSFKTAKVCADCGEELDTVYRERRSFGDGFMGGTRWTIGVLCKKCARGSRRFGPHGFRHFGPCETCEREVFVSRSIPTLRSFCSTRCGQAYYRKARRLISTRSRP